MGWEGEVSPSLQPACGFAAPAGYGPRAVLEPPLQNTGHAVLAVRAAGRQPRGLPLPPLFVVRRLVIGKSMATIDTEAGS